MTVLRLTSLALVKLGYLLETLSIPHYSFIASKDEMGSENVLGAGNQQETELFLRRKASGAAEDPQRLYAGEPCCKQFTVQGWKVLDCVKSLSNPSNPS